MECDACGALCPGFNPRPADLADAASAMREYAARRGWTVTLEVEDVASGSSVRPKREELINAAWRRKIDLILVWRLDRWGRSLLDLIATLQDLLSLGVGFVSLSDALDMATPSGRALVGMLAIFAEFERVSCASASRRASLTQDCRASLMDALRP
ncbi:recombinase family protein [Paraburkholderia sp. BL9I2N2]|uniref:recombinase family protein n=1 Tax=Paraburkholderia sp. BL9I2N2 TaxID=1938809 RepID=UPI00243732B1|nr:recombinase family protein [Paraburkholderia sp. BL9I2N2]